MLRAGLTGAAGAGKSTVARGLAARGVPILDADRMAHALYVPGSALVAEVARALGPQVLAPDGGIDRRALGALVFADPSARAALDAIVHPALVRSIREAQADLAAAGHAVSVLDAALLLHWSASRLVDLVVGVIAPREERLRRLTAQGLSPEDAARRLDVQVSDDELRRRADLVIENAGTPEALEARIDDLAALLRRRSTHA